MTISVIIPIYNVESYIERCLRSLFTQTLTEGVEFILVNDATPDNSMEIVANLIQDFPTLTITVINKTDNEGLAAARHTGTLAAKGKYIIHIDSDDWVEPQMLEEMYNKALEADADIVCADFYINTLESQNYISNRHSALAKENISYILNGKISSYLCIKLIKRSIITDNKIALNRHFNIWEDLALSVQLFYYAKKIVSIKKSYYHYRQNENSLTKSPNNERVYDHFNAILEVSDFLSDKEVSEDIIYGLRQKQVQVKYVILRKLKGTEQKKLLEYFPEANKFVLGCKALKIYKRILLHIALRYTLLPVRILFSVNNMIRPKR